MTRPLDKITKVPLATLTTPREGAMVLLDRWWVVDDEGAYRWGVASWQCNSHRTIVERLAAKAYPDARIEFIPVAYVDHSCGDYL